MLSKFEHRPRRPARRFSHIFQWTTSAWRHEVSLLEQRCLCLMELCVPWQALLLNVVFNDRHVRIAYGVHEVSWGEEVSAPQKDFHFRMFLEELTWNVPSYDICNVWRSYVWNWLNEKVDVVVINTNLEEKEFVAIRQFQAYLLYCWFIILREYLSAVLNWADQVIDKLSCTVWLFDYGWHYPSLYNDAPAWRHRVISLNIFASSLFSYRSRPVKSDIESLFTRHLFLRSEIHIGLWLSILSSHSKMQPPRYLRIGVGILGG